MCKRIILLAVWVLLLAGCVSADEEALRQAQQRATLTAGPAQATATRQVQVMVATQTAQAVQASKAQADRAYLEAALQVTAIAATETSQAEATAYVARETQHAEETRLADATATAEAVLWQATQAAQSTGTAQAWLVVQATMTADSDHATSTAEAGIALATGTAESARFYALQTKQVADMQSTVQAGQAAVLLANAAAQSTSLALGTARQEAINEVMPWFGLTLVMLVVAFLLWLAWRIGQAQAAQQAVVRDQYGDPQWVATLSGQMTVLAPDRNLGPALIIDSRQASAPLLADPMLQAEVTRRAQTIQAIKAMPDREETRKLAAALGTVEQPVPTTAPAQTSTLPVSAEWNLFMGHHGPEIPLGISPDGALMLAHPEIYPHFTVAGRSGGGKTRYGTKTKIAAALARGWYVATLGEMAPVGLHVFAGYPNYQDVIVEKPESVIAFLDHLYEEIRKRMDALYAHKAGRWEEMLSQGPRVMIVLDEYAALYDDLQGEQRTRYVRTITNVCRLARKTGIHLVLGVQNPTAESIRPSIRRNTLTQVFQVVDAVASQAIIQQAGAERLQGGQYLAVLQEGVLSGAAFDPTDAQIAAYLNDQKVKVTVYDQPGFLKQIPEKLEPLPDAQARKKADDDSRIIELAEKVRPLWKAGAKKSDLARELRLSTGGTDWDKVLKIVAYLERSSSSPAGEAGEPGLR